MMESVRVSTQAKVVLILLSLVAISSNAFITPFSNVVSTNKLMTPTVKRVLRSTACRTRKMASDGVNNEATTTSTVSGKRRKRKDGNQLSPPTSFAEANNSKGGSVLESTTQKELKLPSTTPPEKVVVMKVRDIRDVVSGAPESTLNNEVNISKLKAQVEIGNAEDDDELADDEEWEYFDVDENGNEIIPDSERVERDGKTDDSIEQLLADARQMRRAKPVDEGGVDSSSSTRDTIFEVISTIVTVDFFVVIGLLAWFLLGIFCSSVLHNDAVQIAFNMNFERVTQPALGILMIGSVAGALGNKEEDE